MPELNLNFAQQQQLPAPEPKPWEQVAAAQTTQASTRPVDPMSAFVARLQPYLEKAQDESVPYAERYEAYILYCQTRRAIQDEQTQEWHAAVKRVKEAELAARSLRELVSMSKRLETIPAPAKQEWERR